MFPDFRKPILHWNLQDIYNAVWYTVIIAVAWMAFQHLAFNALSIGLDDSDKDAWHRSGVSVVTDYKTGQQYLKTPEGFLTPRLGVK